MSVALAILAHALRMLVFEVGTTLRVLMPALLVVMGCSLALTLLAPGALVLMQTTTPEEFVAPPLRDVLLFLLFGLIGLFGYALMAILWHRHVLLNGAERPEELRPSTGIFLGYLWRAFVVACVQLVAAIPVALVMGVLGAVILSTGPAGGLTPVIGLLGSMVFIWIALRFSVVLPAAAMGQSMPVGESWAVTKTISAELWGVAALLTGLNTLTYFVTSLILPDTGAIAGIAYTLVFVVEGLVFVSVLTTLYGHLIEGRSLGQ